MRLMSAEDFLGGNFVADEHKHFHGPEVYHACAVLRVLKWPSARRGRRLCRRVFERVDQTPFMSSS